MLYGFTDLNKIKLAHSVHQSLKILPEEEV